MKRIFAGPVFISGFLILLIAANTSFAQTLTWNGYTSSDWSDYHNWSTWAIPADGDKIFIHTAGSYNPIADNIGYLEVNQINVRYKTLTLRGNTHITNLASVRNFQISDNGVITIEAGATAEHTRWTRIGAGSPGIMNVLGTYLSGTERIDIGFDGLSAAGSMLNIYEGGLFQSDGGDVFNIYDGSMINIYGGTLKKYGNYIDSEDHLNFGDLIAQNKILFPTPGSSYTLEYKADGYTYLTVTVTSKAAMEIPTDGSSNVGPDIKLEWQSGQGAASHDVYFGTDYNLVSSATTNDPEYKGNKPLGEEFYQGTALLASGQTYYWRIDEIPANGSPVTGDIWSFTVGDGQAGNPSPENGQTSVTNEVDLQWDSGIDTGTHDIYIGTNYNDVLNATTVSPEYVDNTPGTSYLVNLNGGTTYFWRIDCVDALGTFTGDVWQFTTEEGRDFAIDTFDDYTDTADLQNTWTVAGGATIALETNRELYTYRYSGLRLDYSNITAPWFSQVVKTYPVGLNLTTGGVESIVLYYLGDPNIDGLYVTLDDGTNSSSQHITDTARLGSPQWQELNFDISGFTGVNLTDIREFSIGIISQSAPPGGSCSVYIDEIAAFPRRCTLANAHPADLDGDCQIGPAELQWVMDHWLSQQYTQTAADPGTNGLIAYYNFNETSGATLNDSSANSHNGTVDPAGSNNWDAAGYMGGCLDFDGTFGVTLPGNTFDTVSDAVTVSVWINADENEQPGKPGLAEMGAGELPAGTASSCQWDTTQYMTEQTSDFAGSWHHWAFVKDTLAGTMRIYKDGILVSQNTTAATTIDNSSLTRIGSAPDGTRGFFRGKMDEMRIFNMALPHSNIAYLAGLSQVDQPIAPALSPVDPVQDGTINLKDFATIASDWTEQVLWP